MEDVFHKMSIHEIPTKSAHDSLASKDQRKTFTATTKKYQIKNIDEILNNHASDPVHINNIFVANTICDQTKIQNDMFNLRISRLEPKTDSYLTADNKLLEDNKSILFKSIYDEDQVYNNEI